MHDLSVSLIETIICNQPPLRPAERLLHLPPNFLSAQRAIPQPDFPDGSGKIIINPTNPENRMVQRNRLLVKIYDFLGVDVDPIKRTIISGSDMIPGIRCQDSDFGIC